jgi:thiamine pyrophosphate-dependent acetolactate synthase large subunit-like protein
MTKKSDASAVNRRKFLAGAAVAGAAVAATDAKAIVAPEGVQPRVPTALRPTALQMAQAGADGVHNPAAVQGAPGTKSGKPCSDFMVDVVKSLDIDYVITNPASSCRGIHESFVTYGGNTKPELLTATHEEVAAAMAHGYYKVAGKPIIALCHGTVGLQHASMAIYNAWCDRVPIIMMVGNSTDAAMRQPGTPTLHSVQDPGALVRDFTKWDDQPGSLQHYAESMVRAYRVAMTPPLEPVLISVDEHMQEETIHEGERLSIPKLVMPAFPQGDSNAVREAARMLANAENPVIVCDRAARTANGLKLIVDLAETLQATVIDQLGRMNFPNLHPLYARGAGPVAQADVILGLEVGDFFGTVNDIVDNAEVTQSWRLRPNARTITIGTGDLYIRGNYQDFQRFQQVDVPIGADAETTLPSLVEAVKAALTAERRAAIAARGETKRAAFAQAVQRTKAEAAASAWNASPISSARLSAELWAQIRNEDWALVSRDQSLSNWPHRLWDFKHHYQFIGGPGGQGIGYALPAAVGAALAHKPHGRLVINLQNDGDSMYVPGAYWTAAKHDIPMLTVMHNNRAYHQEVMHMQRMASWRQRGMQNAVIGTTIDNPNIDFAMLAKSMGVVGFGPIENPNDLAPAITRAVAAVKAGEPALIDVVTQPR